MATMKAVRIQSYGGPVVLQYEDASRPTPSPGELLIKVHAASVNSVDWETRAGYMKELLPRTLPPIPGWDASGVVEAVGTRVTRFKKGDEVYVLPNTARNGAYAEYAVAKEEETARKPKSLDHVQAAASLLAALTTWQALFEKAELGAGQRVLIHGAAGRVGSFAVQLAKWKGAHVIGAASRKNHALLRELGVDESIDYFEGVVRDVDVVLDTIGVFPLKVLKRGGVLVSVIGPPPQEEAARYGVRAKFIAVQPSLSQLAEIARLIDSGQLKPVVATVLSPFDDAFDFFMRIFTNGKVTEDKVGPHGDLIPEFPYVEPPQEAA